MSVLVSLITEDYETNFDEFFTQFLVFGNLGDASVITLELNGVKCT